MLSTFLYSSPSLIGPHNFPRKCDHIREVAFGEGEKCICNSIDSSQAKDLWPY